MKEMAQWHMGMACDTMAELDKGHMGGGGNSQGSSAVSK